MIDPEKIDFTLLPCVDLSDRNTMPKAAGIYFAIDSLGVIQYIGQTKNLNQRWRNDTHHKLVQLEGLGEITISYMLLDESLLEEVESALINWFQPVLNGVGMPVPLLDGMDMICRLPQLMEARGINQKQLAAATGLSPTTVSKLYRNQLDRFDKNTLLAICKYFECRSINELIEIVE